MIPARAMTLSILIAAVAPAAAQPAASGPVLDAAAPVCVAGVKDAYRKGYADGVDAIFRDGTGADRQRAVFARSHSLVAVMLDAVEGTAGHPAKA